MKADAVVSRLRSFLPAELRKAERQLAVGNDPDRAVHEVRKSIKRLRAALRLAHDLAPGRAIEAVGAPLREAAHLLGPLRDHLVLGQTGKNIAQRHEEPPPLPPGPESHPILKQARKRLRQAAGGLRLLLQEVWTAQGVKHGLRAIYKRARRAMGRAHQTGSDGDLHAWRRRAKDLFYVLQLVEAPDGMVTKVQRLTQLLGDDHDLATFIAHHGSTTGKAAHDRLVKRANKRRRPLQRKAFRLGAKLLDGGAGEVVRHAMK
jgi:CHAD domain-containing protein